MNALLRNRPIWFAGLLGAAMLAGSPLSAQADQGKWWDPQQGGSNRADVSQRDRRGTPQFQRDVVSIRDGNRGPKYRANRVWVRPTYVPSRRVIVVRPVRYYVQADVTIGHVRFRVRSQDQAHYLYGCNFCDERFDTYAGYLRHVQRCSDRPSGYRVEASDWDNSWSDSWNGEASHGDEYGHDGYHDGYQGR